MEKLQIALFIIGQTDRPTKSMPLPNDGEGQDYTWGPVAPLAVTETHSTDMACSTADSKGDTGCSASGDTETDIVFPQRPELIYREYCYL
jgi:hypothetical protein